MRLRQAGSAAVRGVMREHQPHGPAAVPNEFKLKELTLQHCAVFAAIGPNNGAGHDQAHCRGRACHELFNESVPAAADEIAIEFCSTRFGLYPESNSQSEAAGKIGTEGMVPHERLALSPCWNATKLVGRMAALSGVAGIYANA